jgi:hypothetical protein
MTLKTRLKAIETKLKPVLSEKRVFIISCAFMPGTEKPLIGCEWCDDYIERLENENENAFYDRVEKHVKSKQDDSLSISFVRSIYAD